MLLLKKKNTQEREARQVVESPAMSPDLVAEIERPPLLSVDDAIKMPLERMSQLFVDHLNPGQLHFMKLLGFHKVKIERAEGMFYTDQNGRKILDFFGGFGSLSFGHNHPRILAARKRFPGRKPSRNSDGVSVAICSGAGSQSGQHRPRRSRHGVSGLFRFRSHGSGAEAGRTLPGGQSGRKFCSLNTPSTAKPKVFLSITDSKLYQSEFNLVDDVVKVPFGDLDAIRTALENDPSIGIVCLETIQGGAGIV